MKKLLVTAVLSLSTFFSTTLNAQLENTIWYMGSANGVTFTSPNYFMVANTHNALGLEGCGVATNPITGVLMFYTDGIHLYNANHVSMPNEPVGGLGGCPSAAQSVVFCKVPGKCLQYYVFVNGTGFGCTNNDLSVYLVDMTLNGGLGDIVPLSSWDTPPPSNVLNNAISESMTLIPISGTDEFWLVGKINTQAQMYAYKIDANFQANFTNPPITSNVGISSASSWNMEYSAARPITQNVAIAYPNNATGFIYTLGFDPANGTFTNPVLLVSNINGQAYDVEWSATGNYLYYTAYSNFQQVDRWDFINNVPQSLFLATSSGIQGGGLKTGPDGIIYFLNNRNGGTLASITNSDSPNPVYNPAAFSLPVGLTWQSITLPYTLAPGQISVTENHTMCPGESLTFTETGGASYVWYNQSGITASTASITVSPTANTFYTVAIVAADGCVTYKKHVVTIVSCACVGDSPAAFEIGQNGLVGLSYNNGLILINQDVTLSASVAFTNCEIKLAPDVQIIVPNGMNLKVINTHMYACHSMWEGILVKSGGSLNMTSSGTLKTNLIEDAKTAVLFNGAASNTQLEVLNTTFNKNHVALLINGVTANVPNYNITVENNVFTCRDIVFTQNQWTQNNPAYLRTNVIKSAYNPIAGSLLDDQYINETAYSSTTSNAFLKAPYAGEKPAYGIRFTIVGLTSNDNTTNPSFREAVIGRLIPGQADYFNLFDNLSTGILATQSNLFLENNKFQNSFISPVSQATFKGRGIYVFATKTSKNKITVSNSEFINCHYGVDVSNYFEIKISKNTIRSTQSLNPDYSSAIDHRGQHGINIQTNRYKQADVTDNKLYNIETGIVFNSIAGPNDNGVFDPSATYSGFVNIKTNAIQPDYDAYLGTLTTQYVKSAIIANSVFGTTYLNAPANANVIIEDNTLNEVFRGIFVNNWRKQFIIQNNPVIKLREFTGDPSLQYVGIDFNNNTTAATQRNSIRKNSITGFGIVNTSTEGITLSGSIRTDLFCNNTQATYAGLEFNQACSPTRTKHNRMQNHNYGFVLNNSAVIGPQGSIGLSPWACDNEYPGTWPGGTFKTEALNGADPTFSRMFVHNASSYNPNLFGIFFPPSPVPYSIFDNTIQIVTNSQAPTENCAALIHQNDNDDELVQQEHLKKVVLDQIPYGEYVNENRYIAKFQAFENLKENPQLMNNETELNAFFQANQTTNRNKFRQIEEAFDSGLPSEAGTVLNTIENNEVIDAHYLDFYSILNRLYSDSLTPSDSLMLVELARLCPYTDGMVVYQARALYGSLYGYAMLFANFCETAYLPGNKNMMQGTPPTQSETVSAEILIYPNPNSGTFSISCTSELKAVTLFDNLGRKIDVNVKYISDTQLEVEQKLSAGIYTALIETTHGEVAIKKITIR